jgi:hypothetical protein
MKFKNGEISFIYKYVDDIISAIDKSCVSGLQSTIESLLGMKLKIGVESALKEVGYLQLRVGRDAKSGLVHPKAV